MKIHTIKQKMSNSGTIHDIESDLMDRDIKFPAGHNYAVVLAAYYGGKGYTTHKTEQAVISQSHKVRDYSHAIIDSDGIRYAVYRDYYNSRLVKAD